VTLNRRITELNALKGETFLPTIQTVERRRSMDVTLRRPSLFYWFNWAKKRILHGFIERAEYFLEIRLVFDDERPPCQGFRYAALLKNLLIDGDALDTHCDQVTMEAMEYRMSEG
jgi:hypothetical protein